MIYNIRPYCHFLKAKNLETESLAVKRLVDVLFLSLVLSTESKKHYLYTR